MGIKEDYEKAKSLAKEGEYEAAIAILEKHKSNPKIAALIKQLQSRLPTKKKSSGGRKIAKWIAIAALFVFIACGISYVATNWNWWFGDGKEDFGKLMSTIRVCSYVQVYTEIESCDHQKLLDIYGSEVDYCYSQYGEIPTGIKQATEQWIQCLLNEDVIFMILTEDDD